MTERKDSSDDKGREILNLVDKFKTLSITGEEALEIMTNLKNAIEKGDEKYVSLLCARLGGNTEISTANTCEDLMSMANTCTSLIIQYKTIDSDNSTKPKNYIKLLTGKPQSCAHAYIYVDKDFTGFLDKDIDYLASLGITVIDIVRQPGGESIYSGPLINKIESKFNKERQEGWLILIGVIIFVAMGIFMKTRMN